MNKFAYALLYNILNMKATCLVLLLAITASSYSLPFDPVKNFIEGAHLSFAGTPFKNQECLNLASQTDLYNNLEKLFVDFGDDLPLHVFASDILAAIPDFTGIMNQCNIDVFTNALSDNFGQQLISKIASEYSTINALMQNMKELLEDGEFTLAGEQFGNIVKLIVTPDTEEMSIQSLGSDFDVNVGKFTSGLALGFQTKPTPLSRCYNATTTLGVASTNVHSFTSKCLKLNFSACNELPGYLTIFNACVNSIYNDCKVVQLISDIGALDNATKLSETIFLYFSNQVQITTWINQFDKARMSSDYFTMGQTLASILRVLLKFNVN